MEGLVRLFEIFFGGMRISWGSIETMDGFIGDVGGANLSSTFLDDSLNLELSLNVLSRGEWSDFLSKLAKVKEIAGSHCCTL
jgi:hypothetical protein